MGAAVAVTTQLPRRYCFPLAQGRLARFRGEDTKPALSTEHPCAVTSSLLHHLLSTGFSRPPKR